MHLYPVRYLLGDLIGAGRHAVANVWIDAINVQRRTNALVCLVSQPIDIAIG